MPNLPDCSAEIASLKDNDDKYFFIGRRVYSCSAIIWCFSDLAKGWARQAIRSYDHCRDCYHRQYRNVDCAR